VFVSIYVGANAKVTLFFSSTAGFEVAICVQRIVVGTNVESAAASAALVRVVRVQ
jgi:hypothetical protein